MCWYNTCRTPQDRTRGVPGEGRSRPARHAQTRNAPGRVIFFARPGAGDPTDRTTQLTPFTGLDSSSGMSGPALSLNTNRAVND